VLYKCDNFYSRENEAGIRFDDPSIAINWKVPVDKAIISDKDRQLPLFSHCRNNFEFAG
jgi:dTDP-4-dehydrorhamnose 3,5-epimerase